MIHAYRPRGARVQNPSRWRRWQAPPVLYTRADPMQLSSGLVGLGPRPGMGWGRMSAPAHRHRLLQDPLFGYRRSGFRFSTSASAGGALNEQPSVLHGRPTRPPRNKPALVALSLASKLISLRTGTPGTADIISRRCIAGSGPPANSAIQRCTVGTERRGHATANSRPTLGARGITALIATDPRQPLGIPQSGPSTEEAGRSNRKRPALCLV
jgi:hypothetical protein